MKNEMDAMNMDERQRRCWLQANRVTLIAVGLVWLGMIAWELAHDQVPVFLIVMVFVFAVVRVTAYWIYSRAGTQP
jgi:hypothetical protein